MAHIQTSIPPLLRGLALCLATILPPAGCASSENPESREDGASRPNIVLIIADDLGFFDLGAYGSEIQTPNLDRLAETGLKFTNFHTAPTCAPTRAMLLSGSDNHLAGFGTQENLLATNQEGQPGYEMRLSKRVVTVATLLAEGGYRTYLSGKWHMGVEPFNAPKARGFQRSVALLQGGGSHFNKSGISPRDPTVNYREQGEEIELPDDFYSSDYFTTRMMEFLSDDEDRPEPFFAYLAFTAPHWPIHARDEDMARYRGRYAGGYEEFRAQRIARARQLGVIPETAPAAPPTPRATPWADLSEAQRKVEARRMEIYAAMIDRLDWNVGRLMRYLDSSGQRENTIVMFISDNGGEAHLIEGYPSFVPWLAENYDNSFENMGREGSFVSLGPGWTTASNGLFRMYKGYMTEGGTRVPAIVNAPSLPGPGTIIDSYTTVMDLAPTFLDIAGLSTPTDPAYAGGSDLPMRGASFKPLIEGKATQVHPATEAIGWELFGRRALQRGDWKALFIEPPRGSGEWQLFNMAKDPGETNDLADERPQLLAELVRAWEVYADANGVILPSEPIRY